MAVLRCKVPNLIHRGIKYCNMYAIKQIKIRPIYRDMVPKTSACFSPRPRPVCQVHLEFGLSASVTPVSYKKTSFALGTMPRYYAQNLKLFSVLQSPNAFIIFHILCSLISPVSSPAPNSGGISSQ